MNIQLIKRKNYLRDLLTRANQCDESSDSRIFLYYFNFLRII